jgi:hypothetical protein
VHLLTQLASFSFEIEFKEYDVNFNSGLAFILKLLLFELNLVITLAGG